MVATDAEKLTGAGSGVCAGVLISICDKESGPVSGGVGLMGVASLIDVFPL